MVGRLNGAGQAADGEDPRINGILNHDVGRFLHTSIQRWS